MKKIVIPVLLLIFVFSHAHGQRWKLTRYEAIIGLGTTNIFGDIGGTADENNLFGLKDIRLTDAGPSLYIGARYKITEDFWTKANFIFGYGTGNDEGSRNHDRGYSFRTMIFEPSVQLEYAIIPEERRRRSTALYDRRGMINHYSKISVFVFTGIGGAFFNPRIEGAEHRSPEEITVPSKITMVLPMGIGTKFSINNKWSVNFEIGGRYTFTDWLDGFKPNIEANKANDIYYFSSLGATYRIETDRRGRPVLFPNRIQ